MGRSLVLWRQPVLHAEDDTLGVLSNVTTENFVGFGLPEDETAGVVIHADGKPSAAAQPSWGIDAILDGIESAVFRLDGAGWLRIPGRQCSKETAELGSQLVSTPFQNGPDATQALLDLLDSC